MKFIAALGLLLCIGLSRADLLQKLEDAKQVLEKKGENLLKEEPKIFDFDHGLEDIDEKPKEKDHKFEFIKPEHKEEMEKIVAKILEDKEVEPKVIKDQLKNEFFKLENEVSGDAEGGKEEIHNIVDKVEKDTKDMVKAEDIVKDKFTGAKEDGKKIAYKGEKEFSMIGDKIKEVLKDGKDDSKKYADKVEKDFGKYVKKDPMKGKVLPGKILDKVEKGVKDINKAKDIVEGKIDEVKTDAKKVEEKGKGEFWKTEDKVKETFKHGKDESEKITHKAEKDISKFNDYVKNELAKGKSDSGKIIDKVDGKTEEVKEDLLKSMKKEFMDKTKPFVVVKEPVIVDPIKADEKVEDKPGKNIMRGKPRPAKFISMQVKSEPLKAA